MFLRDPWAPSRPTNCLSSRTEIGLSSAEAFYSVLMVIDGICVNINNRLEVEGHFHVFGDAESMPVRV